MAHVSAPCEPRGASARGVQVQHAGGARARRALAGGRAGRTGANVPRPERHGVPVQASDTGLRRQASGRAVATAGSQPGTGAGAAPFLHDEAGPLLAVLLHLHLLIVRHDPPVQTATTRDASVRRTASRVRSRSFLRAPAALGEVCEDGTRPRLAGLQACAPCLAAHVASTLCVVRHACQVTVHIPYPPCSAAGWALRRGAVAEMGGQP